MKCLQNNFKNTWKIFKSILKASTLRTFYFKYYPSITSALLQVFPIPNVDFYQWLPGAWHLFRFLFYYYHIIHWCLSRIHPTLKEYVISNTTKGDSKILLSDYCHIEDPLLPYNLPNLYMSRFAGFGAICTIWKTWKSSMEERYF